MTPQESSDAAQTCQLGLPVSVIADAAGEHWPAVENLVALSGLITCDGRQCVTAHGVVVVAVDEEFEPQAVAAGVSDAGWWRMVHAAQGGRVPLVAAGTSEVRWAQLRARPKLPSIMQRQATRRLRAAADSQSAAVAPEVTEGDAGPSLSIDVLDRSDGPDSRRRSGSGRPRPVVAVAVDGVLNVRPLSAAHNLIAAETRLPGYQPQDVVLPGGVVKSPLLRGGGDLDLVGTLWLNPLHGQWLNRLIGRGIDLAWATTYEAHANTVIAPLLGLPPLPLATSYAADGADHPCPDGFGNTPGRWKGEVLERRFPGRPLVWLDSHAFNRQLSRVEASLQPDIDDRLGLGLHHIQHVEAWLLSIGW